MAQETITQIQSAPDYLKPGIEKFLEGATAQAAQAMDTSKFAPSVVGLGALQQQAQQKAATQAGLGTLQFDPTTGAVSGVQGTGVAGFEPFLQTAQQTMGGVQPFITAAAGRTGPTAFQAFESPYQTAVRDATLASFDEQAAARRQGISDTAAKLGALGAGRTGVQLAEYDRKSDMDRALLQAQLNQAGFTQANQLAAQALGQGDLAFRQAVQDAQTGAARMAAFEPVDRLARFGQGLAGVGGMLGSVQTQTGPAAPQQSPLAGALQAGIGAFSLGKLFGQTMNYNVMKRPMFKMGGKAASQGTGITSGLDEKVNMTDGRANYAEGPTTYQDFLKSALEKQAERDKAIAGMDNLINLQALGRLGQALSTEESSNPLDIIKNIAMQGSEIALPALSAKKKLELKKLDPTTDLAFAKAFKPTGGFGEKVYDKKKRDLAAVNKAIAEVREKDPNADISALEEQKLLIFSGFETEQSIKADIIDSYFDTNETMPSQDYVNKMYKKRLEALGGNAEGGMPNRVNRRMGSGNDGELPEDPTKPINPFAPKPIKPLGDGKMAFDDTPRFELRSLDALVNEFETDNGRRPTSIDDLKRYFYNKYGPDFLSKIDQAVANESKDVAMETQGQGKGNQVFDMLRARLPQEITDDVVQLISYDKTAFADFASIKNQEDVTSFNDKYGTQLVIDVATV